LRSADEVGRIRLQFARDHLAGITALDARMKAIRRPDRGRHRRIGPAQHIMAVTQIRR
jgi:hypothetical protein